MSKVAAFLGGFALAAASAAGAWWFAVNPKVADLEARTELAQRDAARWKRDAASSKAWAEAERRRRLEAETEVGELRKVGPPPAPRPQPSNGHDAAGGQPPDPPGGDLAPELWDWPRRSMEMQLLAPHAGSLVTNPRFERLVRASKAHLEEDLANLGRIMAVPGLGADQLFVCATLLWRLDDPRGVAPLLAAWKNANDERALLAGDAASEAKLKALDNLRTAILRGVANLTLEHTDVLRSVWNDPASSAELRLQAIHGLARRRDVIALDLAASGVQPPTPALRKQALDTLHLEASRAQFEEAALLPVFCKALLTADGPNQTQLCLLALEGFWSRDAVPALEEFAEKAGTDPLAARARLAADAIKEGRPRPEGAGRPPAAAAPPK